MPRYPYPPRDFQCLYEHNCPYLKGLSTTWVWGEYEWADSRYQEHLRIVDAYDEALEKSRKRILFLEKEYAETKAKLQALHQKQFKANRKKDKQKKERTSGNIDSSRKKKRGAPAGHPGWFRDKPKDVDQTVHVAAPDSCPHCQSEKLTPIQGVKEHIQEDIVLTPRTVVTSYLHEQAYCANCSRPVIKAADNELLNAHIGPVARSTAIYLRYRMGLPYRKVQELFKDLFNLEFVPASALDFDRKAALKGEAIYEDLREKIRASSVVHADETFWRNDGVGHYAWYAGNSDLAFFHIDRHRSSKVATSISGTNFGGVLVTDRYAAYNSTNPAERQTCLAHIIRRAKDIAQELSLLNNNYRDVKAESFCARIAKLFSSACKVGQKLSSGLKTHSILPSLVLTARRQGHRPREFLQLLLSSDSPTAQAALFNNSS